METLLWVTLLAALAVTASGCGSSRRATSTTATRSSTPIPAPRVRISAKTASSSRLILGGRVRCTATVSRSVQAGDRLGLTFAVRNISSHPVEVPLTDGGLWLVVRAADGTTYD